MSKIIRILLVAVIISSLFAGVATAGIKYVYINDDEGNKVIEKHVIISHDNNIYECDTDNKGRCTIDDKVKNGDLGKFNDNDNERDCRVEEGKEIPEFPTVALPIAAIIGLIYLFQQRKDKE